LLSSPPLPAQKADQHLSYLYRRTAMMMSEAIATSPVLAGGWALLYLLFGGGLGGAVLLFVVLKAIGR
jgi:hypothetical protein